MEIDNSVVPKIKLTTILDVVTIVPESKEAQDWIFMMGYKRYNGKKC